MMISSLHLIRDLTLLFEVFESQVFDSALRFALLMECYSALQKDGILSFMTTWLEVEIIMLSKINQA